MAGALAVGSSSFLVAVTGLLTPPLPPPRLRRRAPSARTAAESGRNIGYGSFDPSAWETVGSASPASSEATTSEPAGAAAAAAGAAAATELASSNQGSESERRWVEGAVDVDVEKLPTFVCFRRAGDGRLWREDVVGGGDARACEAELHDMLASQSSLEGDWAPSAVSGNAPRQPSPDSREMRRDGTSVVGVEGAASDDSRDRVASIRSRDDGVDGSKDTGNRTCSNGIANIVDLASRADVLRVLGEGQGPVVVMYHAPWCRKCAYLTPVFRRIAAVWGSAAAEGLQAPGKGGDGGDSGGSSTTSTFRPIFCRADVSHPSWDRRTAAAAADAAAAPAAAAAEGITAAAGPAAENHKGLADVSGGATTSVMPGGSLDFVAGETETEAELLHAGSPAVENCDVCLKSGFVSCGECEGKGTVARSSPDGRYTIAVTCPVCVGYKRLRCPSCGGKCYMCD